jgi:hypothetical protein
LPFMPISFRPDVRLAEANGSNDLLDLRLDLENICASYLDSKRPAFAIGLPGLGFYDEAPSVNVDDPYADRVAHVRLEPARAPALAVGALGCQLKKNPGSHPRSRRTVSTTRLAGRPPTVTRVGPSPSLVPGARAIARARASVDRPIAGLTTAVHGAASPPAGKLVQKMMATVARLR